METKLIEIRDHATFVPAIAVKMYSDEARERYLLRRAGYGTQGLPCILLTRLGGSGPAECDPYDWGDRTFATVHHWIAANWDAFGSGDVIDVRFLLDETTAPAPSEEVTAPW